MGLRGPDNRLIPLQCSVSWSAVRAAPQRNGVIRPRSTPRQPVRLPAVLCRGRLPSLSVVRTLSRTTRGRAGLPAGLQRKAHAACHTVPRGRTSARLPGPQPESVVCHAACPPIITTPQPAANSHPWRANPSVLLFRHRTPAAGGRKKARIISKQLAFLLTAGTLNDVGSAGCPLVFPV